MDNLNMDNSSTINNSSNMNNLLHPNTLSLQPQYKASEITTELFTLINTIDSISNKLTTEEYLTLSNSVANIYKFNLENKYINWSNLEESYRRNNPFYFINEYTNINDIYDKIIISISNGFNINYIHSFGYTALLFACQCGYLNIVKLLLSNGANILHQNAFNESALLISCKNNYINVASYIITYICDNIETNSIIDMFDKLGNTALTYACIYNYMPIIELLLQHNANVNIQNKLGYTALFYVVKNKNFYFLTKLLDKINNIDVVNHNNESVLLYALNLYLFAIDTERVIFKRIITIILNKHPNLFLYDKAGSSSISLIKNMNLIDIIPNYYYETSLISNSNIISQTCGIF